MRRWYPTDKENIAGKLFRTRGVWLLFAALLAGILLMVLPTDSGSQSAEIPSAEDYRRELEERTEKLIKDLEGVNDCRVLITLENGYEYLYASDQTLDRAFDNSGTVLSSSSSKEYILDGNGNAIVITETLPTVSGIAVVAENISPETQYRIIRLLQAAYGLSSNRISVES